MNRVQVESIKKALQEYTQSATKTPQAALEALQSMGILTQSGHLSTNYGGNPPDEETR